MSSAVQIGHVDAFVTRIWHASLGHLLPHHSAWLNIVQKLAINDPVGKTRTNRRGWQSQPVIADLEAFKPLLQTVESVFASILSVMKVSGHAFSVEAWANINEPGSYNVGHVHPNALLSAVYYVSVPADSGDLVFRDPRPGVVLSGFAASGASIPPNNFADVRIRPQEALLICFPNWLEHRVEDHLGHGSRLSIAMNVQSGLASNTLSQN